jgi:hypothetical protein
VAVFTFVLGAVLLLPFIPWRGKKLKLVLD